MPNPGYRPYFPFPLQAITAVLLSILSLSLPDFNSCVIGHTFPSPSRLSQLCCRPYFPIPFQAITAVLSSMLSLPLPGYYSCVIVHTVFTLTLKGLLYCYHPAIVHTFLFQTRTEYVIALLSSIHYSRTDQWLLLSC